MTPVHAERKWGAGTAPDLLLEAYFVVTVAALPHLPRLSPPILAFCCLLVLLRLLAARRDIPWVHSHGGRGLLLLGGLLLLFAGQRGQIRQEAGVALLLLMMLLKLYEVRGVRDLFLVNLLSFFLVFSGFLFSQTPWMGLHTLLVVWLLLLHLLRLERGAEETPFAGWLAYSGKLLLQAIPVALLLFLFFPRIAGSLWGLPRDSAAARSGLSDSMTPGRIQQLTLSSEVAFRVRFEGEIPPPEWRYWRGPVFWFFNGLGWYPGIETGGRDRAPSLVPLGGRQAYQVFLEPHDRTWLFTLDLPEKVGADGRILPTFQAVAEKRVRAPLRYDAVSWSRYRADPELAPASRARALALPRSGNPRAHALGASWAREARNDAAIVERALAYFRDQPFRYTLQPPFLGKDPADGFLFRERAGFCEHYASALALLMRAAGVPARVVTGYLGGEVNPFSGYLVVRQSDAHAWVEVWLEKRGWVRVDPTAAIAPERVETGLEAALPEEERPAFAAGHRFYLRVRLALDTLEEGWNRWVIGYGDQRQRQLLERLGVVEADWRHLALFLGGGLAATVVALALWLVWRQARSGLDPAARIWRRFCLRLQRAGVVRPPHQGPLDFARFVNQRFPERKERTDAIVALYLSCRYGAFPPPDGIARLQRAVAAWDIPLPSKGDCKHDSDR